MDSDHPVLKSSRDRDTAISGEFKGILDQID